MKPYPFKGKGKTYQIANYRISRGRRVVENGFGILSQRFRVVSNTILVHPDRVRLHNTLRRETVAGAARDLENEVVQCDMADGGHGDGHDKNPDHSVKEQRDWFNGAGACHDRMQGRDWCLRCWSKSSALLRANNRPFSGPPYYSKNFLVSCVENNEKNSSP